MSTPRTPGRGAMVRAKGSDMPLTITRCRECQDAFHDDGEGWDLCHGCRVAPIEEGLHFGEEVCMNCGSHYLYSAAGPIGFCSYDCASAAHAAIVNPHDWRL